ncbi:PGA4 [Symbiodinium microadriaticum]|nr:PGA4 [Symbiodinium microadriaticum]
MSQHHPCRRRPNASSATLLVLLLLLYQSAPPGRPSGWTTFCTPASKGALESGLQRTRDWRTCHAAVAASAVDSRPVGKRLEDIASDFATTADLSSVKQSFEQLLEEGVVLHPAAYKGPLKDLRALGFSFQCEVCATGGRPEDARSWMAYMAEKKVQPDALLSQTLAMHDSECFQDAECSLNALQRRAASRRIGEHTAAPDLVIPGLPGMGDLPDEDDRVDQDDEDSEEDSEEETPQEEPEEADHSHDSSEQHQEDHASSTYPAAHANATHCKGEEMILHAAQIVGKVSMQLLTLQEGNSDENMASARVSSGYIFGDVVEAVQTPDGDVTVSGVYSTVMFTLSDDYPYACKCVPRSSSDTKVGYCKGDTAMPCYLVNSGSRRIAGIGALLTVATWRVTGKRFFAKGVAYNPRNERYDHSFGSSVQVEGWVDHCVPGHPKGGEWTYTEDVIADEHEDMWSEDLDAIANLGANTVRLYNVDPKNNHTKFMEKVIVPLNGKDWGFLPAFPAPDCYTQAACLWQEIEGYGNVGVNALSFAKQVVKEFSQFNNTLLFTVANELAQNDKNGWAAFPCVKALTRDVHQYQKSCGSSMRRVPLIYSDVDMGAGDRGEVARYLTCALDSEDDAVDVYGLNVYSWCDETYPGDGLADNFQYSPYYEIKKDFKDLAVPMLFTEFGCNLGVFKTKCPYPDGRTWPEVKHLVGKDMGEIISGAIAFQFSMDKEEYGLTLSPNFLVNQTELYLLDNYFNLQKVFHEYNVSSQWDASPSELAECNFTPSEVHVLEDKHHRSNRNQLVKDGLPPRTAVEASKQVICGDGNGSNEGSLHDTKTPSELCAGEGNLDEDHEEAPQAGRVDTFSNWTEIPPSPDASETALWHVGGQAECPAEKISIAMQKNNECHEHGTADLLSTYDLLVRSHLAAGNIEGAMKSLFEAGKPLMKTCKSVLFSLNGAKDLAGATRSFVAEALMSSLPALGVQPSYPMYKDMVNLAATVGNVEMAEGWSQQLREDGFTPDAALYVLLIEASAKAKEPEKAIAHFNQMFSADVEMTRAAFVHVILAVAPARDVEVLSEWMERMIDSGFEPTLQCYEAILEAAQSRRDAELQDFWENFWLKRLQGLKKKPDRDVYNVLIGVPAKYGNVRRAELWLTKMRKAHKEPGTNNWNTVLKGCEVAKDADNAQKLLNRMLNIKKGPKPDATSYNHVIKSCAKAGKPKLAIVWFRRMKEAGLSARGIQFNEVIKATASSATISADYAAEWVRRALEFCYNRL